MNANGSFCKAAVFSNARGLCVKPRVFENIVKGFVRFITFLVFVSIVLLAFLFAVKKYNCSGIMVGY